MNYFILPLKERMALIIRILFSLLITLLILKAAYKKRSLSKSGCIAGRVGIFFGKHNLFKTLILHFQFSVFCGNISDSLEFNSYDVFVYLFSCLQQSD